MKPYFIGLGGQKCATTWIYKNLNSHPELCIPKKDVHFFSKEEKYKKGIEWYEKIGKECKSGQKWGEFSTSYLYSDLAVERIKMHYPEMKLIAVLREPVKRVISGIINDIMAGKINKKNKTIEELFKNEEYLNKGLYSKHLKQYFRKFRRTNILIMIYEDILNDPVTFIRQVYRFLEVDIRFISDHIKIKYNVSYIPKNQGFEKLLNNMADFIRSHGRTFLNICEKINIQKIRNFNKAEVCTNVIKEKDITKIKQYYKESICELEELLGRDIHQWKV